MRLDRDEKPEGMSDDLQADVVTVILERMSNMCVGRLGVCSLLAMYTYEGSRVDPPPPR